jgi:hypothetical protein
MIQAEAIAQASEGKPDALDAIVADLTIIPDSAART